MCSGYLLLYDKTFQNRTTYNSGYLTGFCADFDWVAPAWGVMWSPSDSVWGWSHLKAWLGWMSNVASSLTCLAPGLGGLEQLGLIGCL